LTGIKPEGKGHARKSKLLYSDTHNKKTGVSMNKPSDDPFDVLSKAYENLYERVAQGWHELTDKSGPKLLHLIDDAKHKAVELDELTEEDATKLGDWLKRDLDDAITHMAETDDKFSDWLGFEVTLLENMFLQKLLDTADKTTVELMQFKEQSLHPHVYHTGELAGPGTLKCENCGEKLHFYRVSKIPPCPKCHETTFVR
jgi:hypothetical protein